MCNTSLKYGLHIHTDSEWSEALKPTYFRIDLYLILLFLFTYRLLLISTA